MILKLIDWYFKRKGKQWQEWYANRLIRMYTDKADGNHVIIIQSRYKIDDEKIIKKLRKFFK